MTDETKKLFDAPWEVNACCEIHNKNERLICICCPSDFHIANRLTRLPELYDALVETVYYKCFECMGGLRHNIDMTREELVKNGCPKQNKSNVCIYAKHIELLRKVRDGNEQNVDPMEAAHTCTAKQL